MENDKNGDSQRPLQSLQGITLNEAIASIIVKLPSDSLDLIPEEIKDLLSYREYSALHSFFGLKSPRNRTKVDMIESFLAYTSDVWSELFQLARKFLDEAEKGKETPKTPQQKPKKPKPLPILRQNRFQTQRTPYNTRLNDIISDLYTSKRENWEDILVMCNPEEQEQFREIFLAINPEPLPLKSQTVQRDHLILHYLNGPSRLASTSLENLENSVMAFKSMIDKLTKPVVQ
ncbi:hypothetical protein TVAG_340350 [Trichomonas vaginalis G3]|uniref:Uncharacterized protein n=1 Tax=Trichomonas vaginalis (strain ATCC PRA-98 / G3) TaxID=412133 RepID=A2EKE9_TRIV3|nr:hypothetical protein TVAGG3_0979850 [Trichomonas vaginalis G3]EAY06857.1 hypothetical protein TVAG_340350 [Trichomonas vaginalis G3]KAI5489203.1 hypothetical protein TVAGG3_0979850 [Trichomonas vaginalis G3]|eukprot:XP_001319080.1 hypothetical protein [Trichomonas vaginalis G3]